jgi:GNAT superfamily N-acetyltransferase
MTGYEPIIDLKPPVDCSKDERDRFRDMVLEAGEVEEAGLDGRIARADMLALLWLGTATIGVGALKIPSEGYARKIFKRANAKNEPRTFGLELGWVVVERAHRGHFFSRRIVEALVARAGGRKIYATSVSTRIPMHRALIECGFARDGVEWQSKRRPDEKLFLFVHNGHSGEVGIPENLRVFGKRR